MLGFGLMLAPRFEKVAVLPDLIKFLGGLTAVAGAAGIALAVYLKLEPQPGVALPSAIHTAVYGVSMLVAGMLLYCLGAIVDHLRAIRDFQRRQIEIFERMGKNRGSPASAPTRLQASPVLTARVESPSPNGSRESTHAPHDEDHGELLQKRAS
jgi:hypothetical protein